LAPSGPAEIAHEYRGRIVKTTGYGWLGEFSLAALVPKARSGVCQRRRLPPRKSANPAGIFPKRPRLRHAVRLVFISGMTARCADGTIAGIGDIEVQTRQVCENIKAAVEQAGGTMDDICRVDVYVRNMEHFDQIHKVRREYFKAPAPASTMVEVCKMTSPEYLIEINAIPVVDN
jgi:2-iminobutanoate/2-iminopropanoate deaminase